jgi:hypothetical protein
VLSRTSLHPVAKSPDANNLRRIKSTAEHHLVHDPPGRECEQASDHKRQGEDPDHRQTMGRDVMPARLKNGERNDRQREQGQQVDGAPRPHIRMVWMKSELPATRTMRSAHA